MPHAPHTYHLYRVPENPLIFEGEALGECVALSRRSEEMSSGHFRMPCSGSLGRFNVSGVYGRDSQCDPSAERECRDAIYRVSWGSIVSAVHDSLAAYGAAWHSKLYILHYTLRSTAQRLSELPPPTI